MVEGSLASHHLRGNLTLRLPLSSKERCFFNDATFSLCGAVWRAESAAAHWEYRMNPLDDREKVRAFAMRHACTRPSLCLSPSPGALPLTRSHASGSF